MTDITEAYDFRGRTLLGREGAEIGKVDELYYDEQPEWTLVNTGLFGIKKTFVPIRGASTTGEDVQVPIAKEQVKDAPRVDAGQELSERDEGLLFEHYGVPYTTQEQHNSAGSARPRERPPSPAGTTR